MKGLILATSAEETFGVLFLGLIIVGVVLGLFCLISVIAEIWKLILASKYSYFNKKQASTGLSGHEVAEKLLQGLNITDVTVEKCGFFKAIVSGNSYSPFKKKIYLRKNIYDATSITAVAMATQKVALAKRDHDGDKKIKVRSVLSKLGYFSPFAVLPLVLLGIVIDIVSAQGLGLATIILSCIAVVIYIASFVAICLNIPIEKKANKDAVEFMEKTNLVTSEELDDVKSLYRTYITSYVLDFITAILYILWRIVQLVAKIFKAFKK